MRYFQSKVVVYVLVVLSLSLIGLSFILGANLNAITGFSAFFGMTSKSLINPIAKVLGSVFIFAALTIVLAYFNKIKQYIPLTLLLIISVTSLLTLTSETHWVAEHGGFPVIGSGQALIKYFALIPLALFLFKGNLLSEKQHIWLNYISAAGVLYWIGGIKFFAYEAKAIVPLVETSPFMFWLYEVFSVQQASNLIGGYDIIIATLLGIGIWLNQQKLIILGILGCAAVFIMTQTFLITSGIAISDETILTRLGQFVIKDLWFIANLFIIFSLTVRIESSINNDEFKSVVTNCN